MMTAEDAKQTIRTKALSTYFISPRSTTSTTPNASDSAMARTALVPLVSVRKLTREKNAHGSPSA